MDMEYVVCHYHEIGLKGKNRSFFERKLVANIKRGLNPMWFEYVRRISGRIIVKLTPKGAKESKKITLALKRVFGIAYFAFAVHSDQELKRIKEKAHQLLQDKKFKSFRITTKRSKKEFPLTSQELNEEVGAWIVQKLKKKVDLKNPKLTCFIEIVEESAFLYCQKIKGPGGLPTGASGKIVALLSGGIDSPVAAYEVMKRGVKTIFVHFHSFPYTDHASIGKAKEIVSLLSTYQGRSKLYLIPFAKIQETIVVKTPAKLRVVLYRRMMMRIAGVIAQKERALALVTGESIGQVASQTLGNIKVIDEVADLPVFRPLIGQDKQEIIEKAEQIDTFETSILPHQDCCSRFVPKHPETKARPEEVKEAEKALKISKLVNLALAEAEVCRFGE